MEEIVVVNITEEKPLSKEEREVVFKDISSRLKIPYEYLQLAGELEDAALTKSIRETKPEIFTLLARYLFNYPCIIPIARNYLVGEENLEALHKKYDVPLRKFGAKEASPLRTAETAAVAPGELLENIETAAITAALDANLISEHVLLTREHEKAIDSALGIKYSPTDVQRVMYLPDLLAGNEGNYYEVVEGEEFELCGILIDPKFHLQSYYIEETPGNMSLIDRIRSGYFSEKYLHAQLFAPIDVHYRNFLEDNLMKMIDGKKAGLVKRGEIYYALFQSEEHARALCSLLFDFFLYFLNRTQADYIHYYLSLLQKQKIIAEASLPYNILLQKFLLSDELAESVVELPNQVIEDELTTYPPEWEQYLQLIQPYIPVAVLDPLADLLSVGQGRFWTLASYLLQTSDLSSSPQVKAYEKELGTIAEELQNRELHQAHAQAAYLRSYQKAYQELKYRWIYIRKFGYQRYCELMDCESKTRGIKSSTVEAILYRRGHSIMELIGKKEKDLILIENKKEDKFFQGMNNNRDPWVALVRKLHHAPDVEARKKLYYELRRYLPGGGKSRKSLDWIRSKEGYPIICPHIIQKIEMEIKGMSDRQIHDFLLHFAGEIPLFDAYYCRICGEVLTYKDTMEGLAMIEGDQPIMMYHDPEEGLKDYIWKLVNLVLRNNIEFRDLMSPKDITQLVHTITADLYEIIVLIDKKIRKSRTNSLEEIDGKRKIYTIIYIWAILIKIVLENPTKIKFRFQRGFAKINADLLFKDALATIMSSQDILIRKLKDISEVHLKEALFTSYTNLNALLSKSKLESPRPLVLEDIIKLDPVYHYCTGAYLLNELSRGKKTIKQIIALEESVTPVTIFGRELDYETPVATKLNTSEDSIYSKYYAASYEVFVSYLKSKIYLAPVFLVFIARDPININLYTIKVSIDGKYEKYHKDLLQPVLELEEAWQAEEIKLRAISIGQLPFLISRQYPREKYITGYPERLLARIYGFGEAGFHLHRWNKYVYANSGSSSSSSSKNKILDTNQAKEFSLTPEFVRYHLIDRICSICGLAASTVYDREGAKVKEAIEDERTLVNFFNYYQFRCPAPSAKQIKDGDQLHLFVTVKGTEKCSNCGVTKEMLETRDPGYFKKYREVFLATQKVEEVFSYNPVLESGDMNIPVAEVKNWKYNRNAVNEIVNKTYEQVAGALKMPKKGQYLRAWQNLGLVENYIYDSVLNGEENPSDSSDQFSILARITRLDIYIKEFIFAYNILINYRNMPSLPVEMKMIFDSLDSATLSSIAKLPELFEERKPSYFELLREIKYLYYKPGEYGQVADYLLEYLIHEILDIQNILDKQVSKKFSQGFIEYLISRIIRMERISSKLKEQKAAAVEAAQKTTKEDDPNMQDHFQSRAYDDLVAANEIDKYSYEGMDYGGENEEYNT
jgi:hypothetical protein